MHILSYRPLHCYTTCDIYDVLLFKIALEWLMNEVRALHSSMTNPFISPTLFVHLSFYFSINSLTNSEFAFEESHRLQPIALFIKNSLLPKLLTNIASNNFVLVFSFIHN